MKKALINIMYITLSFIFLEIGLGLPINEDCFVIVIYGIFLSLILTFLSLGFRYFRGELTKIDFIIFIEGFNKTSLKQSKVVFFLGLFSLISNMF